MKNTKHQEKKNYSIMEKLNEEEQQKKRITI